MTIYSLINAVRAKGIILWQENGQLKMKAPKGALTNDIHEQIIARKSDIIAFLSQVSSTKKVPPIVRANRKKLDRVPLSFVQERLWIINQLNPDSAGYNIPLAFIIKGKLDINLLNEAINLIIARHEALRITFPNHEGLAHQVIQERIAFKLETIDLSNAKTGKANYIKAKRLCEDEAALPFNLAEGPLMRGKVIIFTEQEHILMLTMHHIISDDWSVNVLLKELFLISDALHEGKRPDLPELPIQYPDYTIWQRQWLEQEGELTRQLAYWQQKLAGVQESLDLTTDYPRPAMQSFNGASQAFTIDSQLTGQLKNLAEQHGCTLYMILLAIFKVQFYRYTGQEDICIGSAIANRQPEETSGLIGMFVNTLALRTLIESTDTFATVLSKVKTTCIEAYEHPDTPFEKIVDAVQPRRNMAVNPLFQIMVSQNIPLNMPGENVVAFHLERHSSKFDMTVEFTEINHELSGVVEYCTALFKQQTIERMCNNFIVLCRSVVANPNAKITELDFLTTPEKQELLIDLNLTSFEYPREKCIHQLFIEQVKRDPEKIAVVFENEQFSYRQLFDKSHTLAMYLQSLGVKPDSLISICMERSLDMLVGLLGILQAGGAYVPLDPQYPDDRLAYMLEDSKTDIVLTQWKLKNKVAALVMKNPNAQIINLDKNWPVIEKSVKNLKSKKVELHQDVNADHLAYVIYTSGSTGRPKGVMIEHRALVNFLYSMSVKPGLTKDDKLLAVTTYCFDIAGLEFYLPLINGAQLRICRSEDLKDAESLKRIIKDYKTTIMQATPATWQLLFYGGWKNAEKVKILVGGEALTETLKKEFADTESEAWNMYGPTETTIWSTVQQIHKNDIITIGSPIANTQIYIVDAFNNLQPIGIPGELLIAGDGLARGYLHQPELTKEKFVANPFISGTRMYKTGDLARWLDNHTIEYLGRVDTQVKIRGFRIEIGEIETHMSKCPKIKECVVVAQGHGANKKLAAFYVATATHEDDIVKIPNEELKKYLQQFLPDYMLPATFASLESIPLTQNGKINRRVLQGMEIGSEICEDYLAPHDDIEKKLVAIWAQVLELKTESIGVNDNFFDIGGNSISAVSVAATIEKISACKFSPVSLFKYRTIRNISKYIQENTVSTPENVILKKHDFNPSVLQNDLNTAQNDSDLPEYYQDSLAIVGISCHFPDAENHWQFWDNLVKGKESVHILSREEAAKHNISPDILNNPEYVPLKPWMEGKEFFDPEFFQISSGNAALMDPQFRQLLMHSWKAVEDAGYRCEEIENTSVFISASNNFYQSLASKISSEASIMENSEEFVSWVLSQGGTIPTMISYQLGLKGPSAFVHSNCSSSMTGLYYACQSLQSKDVDYALVGAATLSASLSLGYLQMPGLNFSSDGHCKTFDAKADGMVDGEGVGVILVKRAADAIKAGDHIYCLVRGISVNNDGSDKVGFYAPGVSGQTAVIRSALEKTQVNPESINYIEAHGTGTALGDPIEVMAISEAYEKYTNKKQFCAIGSVKPNIGHLDTAAGLAGCIKLAISLYNKKFPPIINYKSPNPQIDFKNSPFYVLDQEKSWSKDQYPRRAGLSSFGIGGTNAHAILEEYTPTVNFITGAQDSELYLLPLSAQKEEVLINYAQKLLQFLDNTIHPTVKLSEMAFTLQTGRKEMKYRVIFIVKNIRELATELQAFIEGKKSDGYFQGTAGTGKKPAESIDDDDDYRELIKHWFIKKKIRKLAQLWANGTKLDWKLLYNETYPLRVSLPTYPFAKVRCWIDTLAATPKPASRDNVAINAVLHPLLHTNISDFSRQSYSSVFNGEEFFLADHQIKGQKVFPAVAYLEMARVAVMQATSGQYDSSMLELRNIVWVQPLVVPEPRQTNINLLANDNGQVNYQIISLEGSLKLMHCEGKAEFIHRPLSDKLDIARLNSQMSNGSVDSATLYAMFNALGTNYGNAHQVVKTIRKGSSQLLAQLRLPVVTESTLNDYILHPAIMDGALQASNVLFTELNKNTDKDALPFALEALRFGSACTKDTIVWVRLAHGSKQDDKLIKLDIDLCDPDGNVCVQMRGFSFRMISKDQNGLHEHSNPEGMHLIPVWQPQPLDAAIASRVENRNKTIQQHHVILCEIPGIQTKQLEALIPDSQYIQIEKNHKNIAERYADAAVVCFEKIQTIFKNKPKRNVLIQIVITHDHEQNIFAGLSGLLKTASLENPDFIGQIIQIDEQTTADQLVQLLLENKATPDASSLRYVNGKRNILQWQPIAPAPDKPKIAFNDQGVYLITGGLGGLGILFTKEIIQQVTNGHVILTGRSELTHSKKAILDILDSKGTRVIYYQTDTGDASQVDALITSIVSKYKQLNGIIHCAGIISDNFILKKTPEEFRKVLEPKVKGTLNLDLACRNIDLDFIVLFSSDSALGSVGQADYATANGFMDQFAAYRNQLVTIGQRNGQTLSVNWPLWQDGGMSIDPAIMDMLQKTTGMRQMPAQTGIEIFYRCLEMKYNQVLVTISDASFLQNDLPVTPTMQQINDKREAHIQENTLVSPIETFDSGSDNLLENTQEFLKKQFSELFKLPHHQINTQAPLENYGIDSILAISITNQLEKTFGTLSKTLLFEYQTIHDLSEYFIEAFKEKLTSIFTVAGSHKKNVAPKSEIRLETKPEIKSVPFQSRRFYQQSMAEVTANSTNGFQVTNTIKEDPIAIIGISGRYPESPDIETYWNNLKSGKDCIIEVPKERWDWRDYYTQDRSKDGAHYSKWGGFIEGVDEFDPKFFSISPKEAEILDPQERLFLQHAWLAIEDAGYTRASLQIPHGRNLPGQVGVYVGVMYSEYQLFGAEISLQGKRMGFGNSQADVANRVSFVLNVHGPSLTVDTMCSSSLTSIHLACQDLKLGRTDMAVAGGVNVSVHPNKYLLLSSGQYISTTGHCHSFGVGGDGYIPGEGVGALILKRLSDAEQSGDHIYGIIRGSALNHGGKPNGYTVPNPQAQAGLISQILEESNTNPRHISYIEAHGTGTPLGDPIEITALTKAFYQNIQEASAQSNDRGFCMIGSVKSNIGHCESAAGVAAITKILLQMKHQQIVPSLHSKVLNPNIDFEKTPFVVNQTLKTWEQPVIDGKQLPRIAGVSSFGAGGSNAHLILEEYPVTIEAFEGPTRAIIPLSARTPDQLKQKVHELINFIRKEQKPIDLVAMAYTLQVGREAMEERLGFIVDSIGQLLEKLQAYIDASQTGGNAHIENVYQGQVKRNKESMLVISQDDDMRETIDKWIVRNKIEKLLDLWVKGLDLDWQKLYGDVRPKRISLPAYPFAKERYWWNDAVEDGKLTIKQLIDRQLAAMQIHPMLHVNTSDLGQQSYCTMFSGDESFMKDYQTTGQKIMPSVAYLEIARAAVENALPVKLESGFIGFYDTVFGQPVIINKNKQVRISLFAQDNEHIDFEIHSEEAGEEIIHCQGHAVISQQSDLNKLDITHLKTKSVKNQQLAEIQISETIENNMNGYTLYPDLLDRTLQSAMNLVGGSDKSASFPDSLESVNIFSACKRKMVALMRYTEGSQSINQNIKLDIDLCDEQGNICVQMHGVSYSIASMEAFDPKVGKTVPSTFVPRKIPINQTSANVSFGDHQEIFIQSSIKKPSDIVLADPGMSSVKDNSTTFDKLNITLTDAASALSLQADTLLETDFVSLYEYGNGVFSIQINNATLSKDVAKQIVQALNTVKQSGLLKVLLIRGGYSDFLHGNRQQNNDAVEEGLYHAISAFPYPVIAIMQGNAGGAGFIFGSLCDFMICSEQSSYCFSDPQSGLFPSAIEDKLLKERFGIAQAHDFMYLSAIATGSALKDKGWNVSILPNDQIEAYIQKLELALIKKPQKSLRLLKQHLSRHILDIVNELTVVDPFSFTIDVQPVLEDNNIPSFTNIKLETYDHHVLVVHLRPVAKDYQINDFLTDLTVIFEWLKQSFRHKSIVIKSDQPDLLKVSGHQFSQKTILDFSNLILNAKIPVVAVLDSNSYGVAWLLSLLCDCCVYNKAASYATADILQNPELTKVAALIFDFRFGNAVAREILLSGKQYSGFELQQRIRTLQVTGKKQALPAALKIAASWANLPASILVSWKQHNAISILGKINNIPEMQEAEEGFKPIADASGQVFLNSKVISAKADTDGILVVKMEDREAKNMFSDALTQGIIEVFEHIKQTSSYKVVVLTGFDNYFASGGTKEDLLAIQKGKTRFTDTKFYHVAMECSIPVIAAMQGHAIGAGWALGMFADYILFSEESKYLSPYMNFGFTPGAGATFILPGKIGYDLARETLLIGREISGSELRDRGIQLPVISRHQVVPDAMTMAKQIAKNTRGQLIAVKNLLTQHLHNALEETYQLEQAMHEETFVGQSETLAQIENYFGQVNGDTVPVGHSASNGVNKDKQAHFAQSKVTVSDTDTEQPGLTAIIKKYLSQELHMQETDIDEDMQFIDLGLDSITGVTWVRKINEKYHLTIETTKIYSYPTLTRFSRYVQEELSKQSTWSKTSEAEIIALTIN